MELRVPITATRVLPLVTDGNEQLINLVAAFEQVIKLVRAAEVPAFSGAFKI